MTHSEANWLSDGVSDKVAVDMIRNHGDQHEQYEAVVLALLLGLTAPDERTELKALMLATAFSKSVTADELERAKTEAVRRLKAGISENQGRKDK